MLQKFQLSSFCLLGIIIIISMMICYDNITMTKIMKVETFRTKFGLFGIMTCFDALFKHPFIDLVEDKGR